MKKALIYFAAGCLGGVAYSLTMWGMGDITVSMGVSIAPALSLSWLYSRVVWGGIWGLAFLLPIYPSTVLRRAIIISLFPSIVQLFVIYPFHTHKGMAGLSLGVLTPLFILFFNWVWAVVTALTIRIAK